jgi:hypothetical protein
MLLGWFIIIPSSCANQDNCSSNTADNNNADKLLKIEMNIGAYHLHTITADGHLLVYDPPKEVDYKYINDADKKIIYLAQNIMKNYKEYYSFTYYSKEEMTLVIHTTSSKIVFKFGPQYLDNKRPLDLKELVGEMYGLTPW